MGVGEVILLCRCYIVLIERAILIGLMFKTLTEFTNLPV